MGCIVREHNGIDCDCFLSTGEMTWRDRAAGSAGDVLKLLFYPTLRPVIFKCDTCLSLCVSDVQ